MTSTKGRHYIHYLQSDIERAMRHTQSNYGAAKYLGIHLITYRTYARKYFNEDGIDLYEAHKNQAGKGMSKRFGTKDDILYPLEAILNNQFPNYPLQRLKLRLLTKGILKYECEQCGFNEQRIADKKAPLLLYQKNGDIHDFRIINLELLCYNCYFLTVGNLNKNLIKII